MEEKQVKVSVIMGIYNCASTLAKAMDSLLEQTYQNFEIILCDDGSSDNTYAIAKQYQEKYPQKIILLKNEQNLRLNATLNKCIKAAHGEYVARMDGDDISVPERFEKEVDFLDNHPDYEIVSCNFKFYDETGFWGQIETKEFPDAAYLANVDAPFCHAAAMIRKNAIESVGMYSEGKKYLGVEDVDLWYKMYQKGYKGYNIQEFLYLVQDDEDAAKRRPFIRRWNLFLVKAEGYKRLGIFYKKFPAIVIFLFKTLIISILPFKLLAFLRKRARRNVIQN
ncbi:MAG: glycosyltransferase [Oscillospiraceae bacterium]|jgi:glycosyltransferase EpsE|nr:glycosyltransferase [Oscillospiraceae bacterium]